MKSYKITCDGVVVGDARVAESGLYYVIYADVYMPEKGFYRLILLRGSQETDIGLFVPDGQKYTLNKRISRKRIQLDSGAFVIKNNGARLPAAESVSVPVVTELHMYKLVKSDEGLFFELTNRSANLPDNDRIPVFQRK